MQSRKREEPKKIEEMEEVEQTEDEESGKSEEDEEDGSDEGSEESEEDDEDDEEDEDEEDEEDEEEEGEGEGENDDDEEGEEADDEAEDGEEEKDGEERVDIPLMTEDQLKMSVYFIFISILLTYLRAANFGPRAPTAQDAMFFFIIFDCIETPPDVGFLSFFATHSRIYDISYLVQFFTFFDFDLQILSL